MSAKSRQMRDLRCETKADVSWLEQKLGVSISDEAQTRPNFRSDPGMATICPSLSLKHML